MPTLETGISTIRGASLPRSAFERGFTLLEIMVVVAIIGIFLGVATLSTDLVGFDRKMDREADRLSTLVRFASEEALMLTHDYGMEFYETGYRFFLYDHAALEWRLLDGDDVLARRDLDPDLIFKLWMEDREIKLETYDEMVRVDQANGDDEDGIDLPAPQVVIYSTGEVTPFELELLRASTIDEPGVLLSVEFDGKTEVTQREL